MIKKIKIVLATLLAGAVLSTAASAATYTVTTNADTGAGSLRATITSAEATPAVADTIIFDINAPTAAGPHTIQLASILPTIASNITFTGPTDESVTINGGGSATPFGLVYASFGSNVTFQNLTFSNGYATTGGAILTDGTLNVTNCTFSGNNATNSGGAIYNGNNGTSTVTNSTFDGNSAAGIGGGAIFNPSKALTVTGSTFTNNTTPFSNGPNSGRGGAIYSSPGSSTFNLTNSTFVGNSAEGIGGGVFSFVGPLNVANCTFTGNSANNAVSSGGGIWTRASVFNLANTILSGNTAPSEPNLTDASTTSNTSNNFIGGDPKLATLASNGGPTQTRALLAGSPAINAGTSTGAPSTDQRGLGRVGNYDIGAYEFQSFVPAGPNYIVTTTESTDDGNYAANDLSLREAILFANSNADSSNITFDETVFTAKQTITIGSELPGLSTPVTIAGSSAGVTIAGQVAAYDIFTVNSGATGTFNDLTITNGSTGISNFGTAIVNRSAIINNSGRGIDNNTGATVTVTNSTFSGTSTQAIYNGGTANVTNSTLAGNGFGITNNGTANLKNTIVTNNTNGNTPGVFVISADNFIGGNAMLGELADNGGPTFTMLPASDSPVIDAGTATGAPAEDQRGVLRPQGAGIDIGAVEVAVSAPAGPDFVVTTTEDADNGNYLANDISLREAIKFANNNADASDITFDIPGDGPHTIDLAGALPALTTSMDIIGPSGNTDKITISTSAATTGFNLLFVDKTHAGTPTVRLSNLTLADNLTNYSSSGLVGGAINNEGILEISNCTFARNSGQKGGAIYNSNQLTLSNVTFDSNHGFDGGAVYNDGSVNIKNCTFFDNTAANVGGSIASNFGTTTNIGNSLFVKRTTGTGTYATYVASGGTFSSGGYNLFEGTKPSQFNGTGDDSHADLKLGELADNGGPTFTHVPAPDSPAVDNGATDLGTDQRGVLRPQGAADDIGAVEHNVTDGPNFIVTVTEDTDDGNYAANDISLREAINFANANSDDSAITFDPTVFAEKQTITADNIYYLNTNISITGSAAGVTIAGTTQAREHTRFYLFNVSSGVNAEWHDLTITNVYFAIFNYGEITITGSTLNSNQVGLYNVSSGIANITNSTFTGSDYGIMNDNVATINLTNSTLGGNYCGISNFATARVKNSLIVANADDISGGITDDGGNLFDVEEAETGLDPAGLQDNGGPTKTIKLLAGGTAINNGIATGAPATDQRGVLRPQGAAIDTGAFEKESNVAPTVADDNTSTFEDTAKTITLIGSDEDADTLSFTITSLPTHGTLSSDADGAGETAPHTIVAGDLPYNVPANNQVIYQPSTGYRGEDNFQFKANDGTLDSNEATITIAVLETPSLVVDTDSDVSANDGDTSLREAIQFANANADESLITFDIAGNGPHIILLASALDALSTPVTIDGSGKERIVVKAAEGADFGIFVIAHNTTANLTSLGIENGRAEASENDSGGGILNNGILALNDCVVTGNQATYGGGIYSEGDLTVTDSTISNNTGTDGGGIFNSSGTMKIVRSTISGNIAEDELDNEGFGGGILSVFGTSEITNSTISGNAASNGGGAMDLYYDNTTITSSTITDNYSLASELDYLGGIWVENGALQIGNSIVAGNDSQDIQNEGNLTDNGYNLIGNNANVETEFPEGAPNGTNYVGTSVTPLDAKIGVLADNGGPTFTHKPALDSPAFENGDSDEATDQRGEPRPLGAADDIGSVEISPNSAPTLSDIAITAQEDTAYTFAAEEFDAGFADAENNALTNIQITSLPAVGVLKLDGIAVAINDEIVRDDITLLTYTPNLNYHLTDSFGWNGSDGTEYSATASLVNITVDEVNDDPTLDAIPTINSDEQVLINFFAHGEDVDTATVLEYSLVGAPTGATINSATGEFNWTPTEAQAPGSYTFQIKVVDGEGGEAVRDVTINVSEVNSAPELPLVGARTLTYGTTTTYDFAATDSDLPANTLTYSLVGAPTGATINATTGVFSWTPTFAQSNNSLYSFQVRVVDNGTPVLSDEETASFTVQRANTAPVLPFVGSRTLILGTTTTYNFAATDADLPANILTYSLVGAPTGASINAQTGVFSWKPTAAQATPRSNFYSFKIRVTDNGFPVKTAEAAATFTVVYPAEVAVAPTNLSVKADGQSKSVIFTYTVRNNTNVAYSNLKVSGDVFWPTILQNVATTPAGGTTASQSTLSASSRRITWNIPSLPAGTSKTLSVKLTGVVPTNAAQKSRVASGFVLSPVLGSSIPNHTSLEVFLNTYK